MTMLRRPNVVFSSGSLILKIKTYNLLWLILMSLVLDELDGLTNLMSQNSKPTTYNAMPTEKIPWDHNSKP